MLFFFIKISINKNYSKNKKYLLILNFVKDLFCTFYIKIKKIYLHLILKLL